MGGHAVSVIGADVRPARAVRPESTFLLAVLVAGISALAGVGGYLAAGVIRSGGTPGISQEVATSFGIISVDQVEVLAGLGAKALGGASHGISGYVAPDKARVQVSVTLKNLLAGPVAYSPGQFRLVVGDTSTPAAAVGASIRPGTLQPDSVIEAVLSFVVPRNGSTLWLSFLDPGRSRSILINIGRADLPGSGEHGH